MGSAIWAFSYWSQTLQAVMHINGHSPSSDTWGEHSKQPKPDYAAAAHCLHPFASERPAMGHMMGVCFMRLRNYAKAREALSATGLGASLVPLTECLYYMGRYEECANLSARLIDFSTSGLADSTEKSCILCLFSLLLHNAPQTLRKIPPWKNCTAASLFDAAKMLNRGPHGCSIFDPTASRLYTDAARLNASQSEIESHHKMAELLEQSWSKAGIVPNGLEETLQALRNGDMDAFMHGPGQAKMDAWKGTFMYDDDLFDD